LRAAHLTPVDPATGNELKSVRISTLDEVHDAVSRSRRAFGQWRYASVADRAASLVKAADELELNAQEIGRIITKEMGRVLAESIPEVTKSATFLRYFARIADDVLGPTPLNLEGMTLPQKTARILHEPRGVAAIIKPWNAPVQQIIWALAPALMAGCTVIVKPSEYTPWSALALQEAFERSGFPNDVLITLPGDAETGHLLVESDVDVIAFTGSVSSGRKVGEAAGKRLRKCILELSGKDALIVDERVRNLDLVAAGIVYGAFSNCGHWCSSVEHVYLPECIFEELLASVVEKTKALRVGPGDQGGVDMGPVANQQQFDIVRSIVEDALERRARALTGGAPLEILGHESGLFYPPTILVDVPDNARLANENVFGPVVAFYRYSDIDDAIRRANSTNYGLGLSIWTDDPQWAEYATRRSDTGIVWVNEPLQSLAPCPWSVYKDSGYGVELGGSGMREFTYEKVVQSQFEGNSGPRSWYFPYVT
jgi:acyl-CoA reductase-like NAD-dependent aldehyde dehydrogenase